MLFTAIFVFCVNNSFPFMRRPFLRISGGNIQQVEDSSAKECTYRTLRAGCRS